LAAIHEHYQGEANRSYEAGKEDLRVSVLKCSSDPDVERLLKRDLTI
jgi:hypothetical protein